MEKIVARKILSQQKKKNRNRTRNTQFFTTHQKQQKRLPKEQPVNEFHFINCRITVFGRRRKTQQQQQQQGEATLEKTCSPNFLPRAALESAMQSERESLERARA
jgi:hypothetical protein